MKIYISKDIVDPLMGVITHNNLPFHLEQDKWIIVDSIEEADVVPVIRPPIVQEHCGHQLNVTQEEQLSILREKASGKCILLMLHTHMSETYGPKLVNMFTEPYKEISDKVFQVDINYVTDDDPTHIFYDFCLNFAKVHFVDYNKYDLQHGRLWTSNSTQKSFELRHIAPLLPQKKFLVPNNVRPDTGEFKEFARAELRKITSDDECYFSDFQRGITLDSEEDGLNECYTDQGAGFVPIANKYYVDSVVSVYVETVGGTNRVENAAGAVTEKTFVTLLKGHFILPFSSVGFVSFLKTHYGIKFPEWIDYSYDSIDNDKDRLRAYLKVVKELKKLPLDHLTRLANNDIEIRKYNRKLIANFPYDSLYDKVKARINK